MVTCVCLLITCDVPCTLLALSYAFPLYSICTLIIFYTYLICKSPEILMFYTNTSQRDPRAGDEKVKQSREG